MKRNATKTVSVHDSAMCSSFVMIMNPVALHTGPTFPSLSTEFIPNRHWSHRTQRMPSISASTSTAPLTPPRDTQRERVHLALLDCMQTPNDVCPYPAVLPTRERQAHGTQNEQMWCLVAQPLLSSDLVSSQTQITSQSQIHCHTCTQSEYASSLAARRRVRLPYRKCRRSRSRIWKSVRHFGHCQPAAKFPRWIPAMNALMADACRS